MKKINSFIALAIISFLLIPTIISFNYRISSNSNPFYNYYLTPNKDNLKVSEISDIIHINNNWTAAELAGLCTGNGSFSDPYLIEDLEINTDDSGTCILIENSAVYFKIENCTLISGTSYPNAGIRLNNVTKGTLFANNCSFSYTGIWLSHCNNITIAENFANHSVYGIYLSTCNDCNISGNSELNNHFCGIRLLSSNNSVITENIMNNSGLIISGDIGQLSSHEIDTTNLVNGKPLYYYKNEVGLRSDDFLDMGQAILVNCSDSQISGLDISFNYVPISLYYCNNNSIIGNSITNNKYGIEFYNCWNNTLTGNNISNNWYGPYFYSCNDSKIKENTLNNNDYSGLNLRFCLNNDILENVANDNEYGMILYGCYNNKVSENDAHNNSRYGIYLDDSHYNIISKNIANSNAYHGIYLTLSDHNAITGNTANYNSNYGIGLFLSDYNTISGNTLIGNGECIHEERCTGNTFIDNGDCTYGQIPIGLIILISVLSGVGVIGIAILIRRKRR